MRKLIYIAVLGIAGAVMAATYFVQQGASVTVQVASSSNVECLIEQQTCSTDKGDVSLSHPTSEQSNQITAKIQSNADLLVLTLRGVDMDMGVYRTALRKVAPNTYQGDLMLPICTHDVMTWAGTLADAQNDVSLSLAITVAR
uniref:hypothetical protein n=1 Tax=Thaumasiovibrio occultus TaxID=1891184 RepID=UPI000B35CA44|nr:hypothetical protein [Thaumasiovibrio occultus]